MAQEEIKEAYFQTIDEYFKEQPNEEHKAACRQLQKIEIVDEFICFYIGIYNNSQYGMLCAVNKDLERLLTKRLGAECNTFVKRISN